MARINGTCSKKHLSKSTVTIKGHMNQKRMHARSIKIKEEEDCDNEAETALDNGVKTHFVYVATIRRENIYRSDWAIPCGFKQKETNISCYCVNMMAMPSCQILSRIEPQRNSYEHFKSWSKT
jgi:hypothetical protein